MLFDLVSYVDVQVQSNPFDIERRQACTNMNVAGKNVWWRSKIELDTRRRKRQVYIGCELHYVIVS